jgi:hypothetical protein
MSSWGVDFIKGDCFMCAPCYTAEIELFTNAVKADPREIVLSYSPGGDNTPQDGLWVAQGQLGSMYRIVTDFHGGWYVKLRFYVPLFMDVSYSLPKLIPRQVPKLDEGRSSVWTCTSPSAD